MGIGRHIRLTVGYSFYLEMDGVNESGVSINLSLLDGTSNLCRHPTSLPVGSTNVLLRFGG